MAQTHIATVDVAQEADGDSDSENLAAAPRLSLAPNSAITTPPPTVNSSVPHLPAPPGPSPTELVQCLQLKKKTKTQIQFQKWG
jgi:hypothetical protein